MRTTKTKEVTLVTNIATLQNITPMSLSHIGEKALNLAILHQHCNVPQAIIISDMMFEQFLEKTGLKERIGLLFAAKETATEEGLSAFASEINELFMETPIPTELLEIINEAYFALDISQEKSLHDLMEENKEAPLVAVRPSPINYNGNDMHTSILNIRGAARLQKAILCCWASFYSSEAMAWRQTHPDAKVGFAVIVQKMIDAQASGEIHTEYKMNAEEVFIKVCKGLGTALSSGFIEEDKYFITKENLAIASIEIGKQSFMLERDIDSDKTTKVYLHDNYAHKQKIADRHIGELTLLGTKIQKLFGRPQVVDFAILKDSIFVLGSKEPEWYVEKMARKDEEEKKKGVIIHEPTEEEVKQKQKEISIGIAEELEKDVVMISAITSQNIKPAKQEKTEIYSHINEPQSMLQKDGIDINNLIMSIDPVALEQEMASQKEIETTTNILPHIPLTKEAPKSEVVTEKIGQREEAIIKKLYEEKTEINTRELTALEKAAGSMIIQCFKSAKEKIPKEQWAHNPDIRHLAAIVQNYVEKNVPPTKKQVTYAMNAIDNINVYSKFH